jgi:phosphosulfolactate synthase (CoM biosynthesis protein A)
VRYLDFNDSYLAAGETCHPSDNLGAVLAAAEYAGCSGRELLTALAAYSQRFPAEVRCRLTVVLNDGRVLERVMFEAAEPAVFAWYIKNYGPEVNLFVDHSQIVQLECLRSGIWGNKSLWGRVLTYKG